MSTKNTEHPVENANSLDLHQNVMENPEADPIEKNEEIERHRRPMEEKEIIGENNAKEDNEIVEEKNIVKENAMEVKEIIEENKGEDNAMEEKGAVEMGFVEVANNVGVENAMEEVAAAVEYPLDANNAGAVDQDVIPVPEPRAPEIPENVIMEMPPIMGPRAVLRNCVELGTRVIIKTCNADGPTEVLYARIVRYDRHWNLTLADVHEISTREEGSLLPDLDGSFGLEEIEIAPGLWQASRSILHMEIEGSRIMHISPITE